MTPLEQALAARFAGTDARVFARGSAALYALFRSLREEHGEGEVLIPGICCEWVALAALYAGLKPVFADVDPATCGLSPASVRERLSPATRAVVAVYVFGVPFDLAPLLELQRVARFALVEDIAQAVGGRFGGRELGTRGDYTLLSFGADKILKGAGGALVARRALPARLQRIADALPPSPPERVLAQKALSLRNFAHALYDLHRADPGAPLARAFGALAPRYEDLIVRAAPPPPAEPLLRQLDALESVRTRRYANYAAYRRGIAHPSFRVVELPEGAMCWRCPLVAQAPAHAQGLAAALRRAGLHASNHYFPLDLLFHGEALPNNLALGERLVNLWVDESLDAQAVQETVRIVNEFRTDA